MIFFWNTKKTSPSASSPQNRVILNASTIPLNDNPGTLPNVVAAMASWFVGIVFGVITKTNVDYEIQETIETISFRGVWQPFKPEQLAIKPEGQRSWRWFMVHAEIGLILETDECIIYKGVRYRVMDRLDYQEYGYVQYDIVNDYDYTISGTP